MAERSERTTRISVKKVIFLAARECYLKLIAIYNMEDWYNPIIKNYFISITLIGRHINSNVDLKA